MNVTTEFLIASADTGDDLSVEDITAAMADSVETAMVGLRIRNTIPRFADASARTAAFTAAGITPTLGMRSVLTSDEITYRYNGSAWKAWESAWTTYVATLTGFAVGTGGSALNSTKYRYVGGDVEIDFKFIFGTSGQTFPTSPTFTLPSGIALQAAPWINFILNNCNLLDSGTANIRAGMVGYSTAATDKVTISYQNALLTTTGISVTAPWTWAAGDAFAGRFIFTPA